MKKNKKIKFNAKMFLAWMMVEVLFLSLFLVCLHDSRPKNNMNTEVITGPLENIEAHKMIGHVAKIYVTINNETYILYWRSPENYLEVLPEIKKEKTISITIHKNKDILYFSPKKEVVDLRTESTVYYDISYHNSEMLKTRVLTYAFWGTMMIIIAYLGIYFSRLSG